MFWYKLIIIIFCIIIEVTNQSYAQSLPQSQTQNQNLSPSQSQNKPQVSNSSSEHRPEVFAINKSESEVDENFSWSAVGGYKIEDGLYQVEVRGKLLRGRLIAEKTKLYKKTNSNYTEYSRNELFDRFNFEIIQLKDDFTLLFVLPKGTFKMKLVAKIDADLVNYEFELQTSEKWPKPPPPATSSFLCSHCIVMAAGMNYINFSNTVDNSIGNLTYSSFYLPSLQINYRQSLNRKIGLRADININSGTDLISKDYDLQNKSVKAQLVSIGGDYITKPNGYVFGTNYSSGYLFSINQNNLPQIKFISSPNVLSISPLNTTTLSGGGFFGFKFWNSEFISLMRLQLPLNISGFAFDGGIGLLNSSPFLNSSSSVKNDKSFWGIFWSGQFHSYSFKLKQTKETASYSYFVSKIEATYGINF